MACSILGARFVCSERWKMSCQSKPVHSHGITAGRDCLDPVVILAAKLDQYLKHVPPSGLHASLNDVKDILLGVRTINLEVLTALRRCCCSGLGSQLATVETLAGTMHHYASLSITMHHCATLRKHRMSPCYVSKIKPELKVGLVKRDRTIPWC